MRTIHEGTIELVFRTAEQCLAEIDLLPPLARKEVSEDWLRKLRQSEGADPWLHGFTVVHRASGAIVGSAAFKGPPSGDGIVEIAYAIDPPHQGQGFATHATAALRAFAFTDGNVQTVRAHTLPGVSASTQVLTKCGFEHIGAVHDPEDGLVWRWEVSRART